MSQTDMQILAEIRQIQSALPYLRAEVKDATAWYKTASLPLEPARDRLKAAKAAVMAARARLDELMANGEV